MVNEVETLDDIVEAANLFFLSPLLNLCALCRQKKVRKKNFFAKKVDFRFCYFVQFVRRYNEK